MAAEKIARIQNEHGPDSVALYVGNPMAHNYAGLLYAGLFWMTLGTKSRFSASSLDQMPHMLAALEMFGHQALLPVTDLERTQHWLILGANPLVSNGSLMTAPGVAKRLEAIRARGGKVVVVDPRRTETAEAADEHHFIRPGTDALLLAAMIHTIFEENRARLGKLEAITDGVEELKRVCAEFQPERVAKHVGIEPKTIRKLARDFASADRASCYGRIGVCTQEFGGLAAWLVYALNVVTGNLDREGGMMFTSPAIDLVKLASYVNYKGTFDTYRSRVRGLPEFGGELPAATLAEEIDNPDPARIRALVTIAGNPVLSAPNGARLERALSKLDFMLSIDVYANETTRHANVLLPTTFGLERAHYDLVLYLLAVRNSARYADAIFPPAGDARHDWEILGDLSVRVGKKRSGVKSFAMGAVARGLLALGPERWLDTMLRTGPRRLSLGKLRDKPHGIDLGPLEPRLPEALFTKGKRIRLAPPIFLGDVKRLAQKLHEAPPNGDSLVLIGRRQLRSNNSWMHNSHRLVKGGDRCTLLMHPEDAKARGLSSGARVRVASRTGEVEAPLELSDEIARGVVSLPHGWGHARSELKIAKEHAGTSVNDVTDEWHVDALTGNAAFSGVPVSVRKSAGTSGTPD
jgi:anaerobic selenocysteine-containing dehydrogenase